MTQQVKLETPHEVPERWDLNISKLKYLLKSGRCLNIDELEPCSDITIATNLIENGASIDKYCSFGPRDFDDLPRVYMLLKNFDGSMITPFQYAVIRTLCLNESMFELISTAKTRMVAFLLARGASCMDSLELRVYLAASWQ